MSLDNDSMRRDNVALDRGLREIELARDYIQKASNSISAAKSSLDPKITIRAFSSAKQKAEISLRNSRDIITRCNNYIEDTKRQVAYVNNACEEVVSELGNDTKDDKPSLMINPFTNQAMERPKAEDQVGPINQDLYDHPEKYLEQIEKRKAKEELKQQLKVAGYNSTDIERITQGEIDNIILQQRMNEINNEIFKEYCNGDSTRYQALVEAAIVNNMYFDREESLQRKGEIEASISQIEAIKAKAKAEVANYKRIIDGAKFDSKTKMHVYKDTSGVTREFDNESFVVLKGMYESAVAVEVACDVSYDEQTKTLNAELKEINKDLSDPSKKDFKYKSVEEINARIKEIEAQAQSAALEAEKKELLEIKNTIAGNVAVILANGKYVYQPDYNDKNSLDTDKTRDITSYKNPWRLLEIGDNYTFMDSDEFRGALLARMLNGDATIMSASDAMSLAVNSDNPFAYKYGDGTELHVINNDNNQEFYFLGDARQLTFNEYQEWINASAGKKENEPTVISQEEIKIFNYICNTEGYDAGYKYLKGKEAEFDQRNIAIKQAADVDFARSNTWAGALSIFTAIPEAMLSARRIRVRKASGQNLHYYDSYSTSNTWNSTISGDLHKQSHILGYVYDTLYSADRLMLSAVASYATGGIGTLPSLATNAAMYGVPTFTSKVYDSKIKNIADDKAIAYALTCATARTLATSYTLTIATGLEPTFNNMLTNGGLMSKISSIVKNSSVLSRNPEFSKNLLLTGYCMVSQGTVSGTTAVVDRTLTSLADAMINGDKSDLYIKYSNYMNTHDCSPFEGYMYVAGDNLAGSFSTFVSAFGPGALLGGMKANMIINHQKNIQQNINFKEAFEIDKNSQKEEFFSSGNNNPSGPSSGIHLSNTPSNDSGQSTKSSDVSKEPISSGPQPVIYARPKGSEDFDIDGDLDLPESNTAFAGFTKQADAVGNDVDILATNSENSSGQFIEQVEMSIDENGMSVPNATKIWVDEPGSVSNEGSIQQTTINNISDTVGVKVPVEASIDGKVVDSFTVINEKSGESLVLPFAPNFSSDQTLPDINIADWCKLTGAFDKNQLSFMKNLDKIKMKVANNDNKISLDDFNYLLGQSRLSLSLKDKIKKDFEKNGLITGVSNDITQNEIDNTNEDIISESNTVADSTWEVEDDWDDDLSFNIKNIDAETFRYTDYTNVANKLKQKLGQNERLIYDKFTRKFHIVNSETNTEFKVTPAFLRNDDILHITNGLISDKNNGIPRVTIDKVKGADNLILVRSTSVLPIENLVTTPQHGGAPSRGDGVYRGINSSTDNRATIHWAFNGFVAGGFFGASDWNSNPFVILEPYKYHIYDSCAGGFSGDVSFDQDMRLSDEAIILINKNWHDEHANEIPEGLNYRVFDGDPSKCVENVLSEMGYYSNDAPSDITGQNKLQQEFEDIVTEVLKENGAKNVRIRPGRGIYDQYNRNMNRIQAILECNRHQNVRIGKDVTPISNEEFLAIIDNKDALLDVDTGKIDISKYNTNLGDYGRSPKEGLAAIMQWNGIRYNQENGEFYIETYDGWIGSRYGQTSLSNGEIDAAYEKLNSILNVSNSVSNNNTTVEFSNDIETALKEMTEHFGDPGSVVNSLLINSGKNATEILETLSGQEKADFEKYLNDTESGKWLKTLTADEIDAINLRTLSSGNIFNLEKNGNANPRMQKVLNDIDSAIKKYGGLKDDIKLYRGVYSTGFIDQFKDNIVVEAFKNVDTNNPNEILNALKSLEGKSLSTAVNMPTSPGYHQASAASPIIMEITAKKGVNGAYINALSSKYNVENELLLGSNQNLVIKNVEVRDGKIYVICEMSTTNSENEISSVSDLQVIDVSKIDTNLSMSMIDRGIDPNVINMSYKGYDIVYKTTSNVESVINKIVRDNKGGKVLLELNDTIGLTRENLAKLPPNVMIRVLGDYGVENFKGLKGNESALHTLENATYTVEQMQKIMQVISDFESGIGKDWNNTQKAKYAYDFINDRFIYTAKTGGNASRESHFDGLTNLIDNISTCQGFAHTYRELLTRMGIKCYEISGKLIGGHSQHAFNVVNIDGKTVIVDPTRNRFNDDNYRELEDPNTIEERRKELELKIKENNEKFSDSGFIVDKTWQYIFKSNEELQNDVYISSFKDKMGDAIKEVTLNDDETFTIKTKYDEVMVVTLAGLYSQNLEQEILDLNEKHESSLVNDWLLNHVDNIDSLINEDPDRQQQINRHISKVAERLGTDVETFKKVYAETFKRIINDSEIGMRVSNESLSKILDSGEIKNNHLVESNRLDNSETRAQHEEYLFGIPKELAGRDSAIYGMVFPKYDENDSNSTKFYKIGPGSWYGNSKSNPLTEAVIIFKKDSIMDYTTFTNQDSLEYGRNPSALGRIGGIQAPTNIKNPVQTNSWFNFNDIDTIDDLRNATLYNLSSPDDHDTTGYIEAQIYGRYNHTIDNIDHVLFLSEPSDEVIEKLNRLGIKYEISKPLEMMEQEKIIETPHDDDTQVMDVSPNSEKNSKVNPNYDLKYNITTDELIVTDNNGSIIDKLPKMINLEPKAITEFLVSCGAIKNTIPIERALENIVSKPSELLSDADLNNIVDTLKSLNLSYIDSSIIDKFRTSDGFDYMGFLNYSLSNSEFTRESVGVFRQLEPIQRVINNPQEMLPIINKSLSDIQKKVEEYDIDYLKQTDFDWLSFVIKYVTRDSNYRLKNRDELIDIINKIESLSSKIVKTDEYNTSYKDVKIKTYGDNTEFLGNALARIAQVIDSLPSTLLYQVKNLSCIELYDTVSPHNLSALFGFESLLNNPEIEYFETGALYRYKSNTVQIFRPTMMDENNEYIYEILTHELGHSLDSFMITAMGTGFTETTDLWKNAVEKDNNSISAYGDLDLQEDFAEMCSLYAKAINGYVDVDKVKNEYPERYRIMSALYDLNEVINSGISNNISFDRKLEIMGIFDDFTGDDTTIIETLLGKDFVESYRNYSPAVKISFARRMINHGVSNQFQKLFVDKNYFRNFDGEQLLQFYNLYNNNELQHDILKLVLSTANGFELEDIRSGLEKTSYVNELCSNIQSGSVQGILSTLDNCKTTISKEEYDNMIELIFSGIKMGGV